MSVALITLCAVFALSAHHARHHRHPQTGHYGSMLTLWDGVFGTGAARLRPVHAALVLLLPLPAHAAEVAIGDDGFVRGVVAVAAPPDVVRALLADGATLAADSPDVAAAHTTPAGHGCSWLDLRLTPSAGGFAVRLERCPTADGWRERLVDSDVFDAWETHWRVEPGPDGGSLLRYSVHTAVRLPVPDFVLRRRSAASVRISLERVAARCGGWG